MTLPPPLTTVFTTRMSPRPSACAPVAVVSTRAAAPPAAAQAVLPLMILPLSCACQERLCDQGPSTVFGFQAVSGFLTMSPLGGKTLSLAPNSPTQGLWLDPRGAATAALRGSNVHGPRPPPRCSNPGPGRGLAAPQLAGHSCIAPPRTGKPLRRTPGTRCTHLPLRERRHRPRRPH